MRWKIRRPASTCCRRSDALAARCFEAARRRFGGWHERGLFPADQNGQSGRCFGLLAAIVLLAVLATPNQAFAHAALIKAEPADGAVLAQAPTQFSLTFSEPVSPLVLTLVRPDGTPVALTSFRLNDQTVEIDNPQKLGSGHACA